MVEEQEEYMKYLESVAYRYAEDYNAITSEVIKFALVMFLNALLLFWLFMSFKVSNACRLKYKVGLEIQ